MQKTVLFDLDGTLTDSAPGVMNSIRYGLCKIGIDEKDEKVLASFVGPPLVEAFRETYGISEEKAQQALVQFRVYFEEKGMFENSLYPGIADLLKNLKEAGFGVGLATSKPEEYARRILDHFGILAFFDFLSGATMDEKRVKKPEVIGWAMEKYQLVPERTVMVGDRRFDISGGRALGLWTVGVLYGYGDRAELETAGADQIAATVEELERILLNV